MPRSRTGTEAATELAALVRASGATPAETRRLSRAHWHRVVPLVYELLAADDELTPFVDRALSGGGGHLRAFLPALVVEFAGVPSSDACDWVGAACELLHVGSLVHDDLIDADPIRRGEPTLWVAEGTPIAVALGDLLMALGQVALVRAGLAHEDELVLQRSYADVLRRGHAAQAAELVLRTRGRLPSRDWCVRMTAAKTGALFGHTLRSGLVCAGLEPGAADDVAESLGLCFQIVDDLRDTVWDAAAGAFGPDLWEGKPSWVVAAAVQGGAGVELATLLYGERVDKTTDDVERLARLMDGRAAVETALSWVSAYRRALEARVGDVPNPVAQVVELVLAALDARLELVTTTVGPN